MLVARGTVALYGAPLIVRGVGVTFDIGGVSGIDTQWFIAVALFIVASTAG